MLFRSPIASVLVGGQDPHAVEQEESEPVDNENHDEHSGE